MGDFQSEGFRKFGLSWHWPWKCVGALPLVCLVTYVWDYCRGNLDSTLRQRELIFDNVPPSCANIVLTQRHHLLSPALSWFLLSGGHPESPWSPFHHSWNCHQQVGLSLMLVVNFYTIIVTAIASFQIPQKRQIKAFPPQEQEGTQITLFPFWSIMDSLVSSYLSRHPHGPVFALCLVSILIAVLDILNLVIRVKHGHSCVLSLWW